MARKTLALSLLFIWVASALAACGGGASNRVSVTTTDFKFAPASWTVPAGQTITLSLANKGANEHEWVLIKAGQSVTVPFDDDDEDKVFWEIEAQPGETKTETFTAPAEPGEYTIVCGISGHLEQGMEGKLIVK